MPYIISTGTIVNGFAGVISVNQSVSVQAQRLYALGSTGAVQEILTIQKSISLSVYAGLPGNIGDIEPSTDCNGKTGVTITINAGGCGGAGCNATDGPWFLNSYSYSKDPIGWGTCNYSFNSAPIMQIKGDNSLHPATMLCGVGEASSSTDGATTGITLEAYGNGVSLEVGAGSPGIGRCNNIEFGRLISIGVATGNEFGADGTGNASIPWTPLYLS